MLGIIKNIGERINDLFKLIAAMGVMFLGIIIISYCIVNLPNRDAVVLFPVYGSMVGTGIFMAGIFLLFTVLLKYKVKSVMTTEGNRGRVEILEKENASKDREIRNAAEKIERLKAMRVDVNAVTPTLKLGLVELDCTLTDFVQHELEPITKGVFNKYTIIREYIGVVEASFRQKFGVDLNNLKFQTKGNKIIISGYRSEFQGFQNWKTDWKVKEIRTHDPNGSAEILKSHPNTTDLVLEQQNTLMERLENGADLKHIDEGVLRLTRSFLSLILAPLKKEIVLVEDSGESGLKLIDFLNAHNAQIESEIDTLRLVAATDLLPRK